MRLLEKLGQQHFYPIRPTDIILFIFCNQAAAECNECSKTGVHQDSHMNNEVFQDNNNFPTQKYNNSFLILKSEGRHLSKGQVSLQFKS